MSHREEIAELAGIYIETLNRGHGMISRFEQGNRAAEKILAAGYRKPYAVTTKEELEALPDDSVIRDASGDVAEKIGGVWCGFETAPMTDHRLAKYAPITVLHEPEPQP